MFGFLAAFALAAVVTVNSQAAFPANCDRNVTVNAGDTCDGISAKQNVSTFQLATVNQGIIDEGCTNLNVGEVICLGITGRDCKTVHVVQPGDDCDQIEKMHGISSNTLLTNNPIVGQDCSALYAGEVLCVSSTIYVNTTYGTTA